MNNMKSTLAKLSGTKMPEWTKAQDEKYDKRSGTKEGSKKDTKIDLKHGVKETLSKLGGMK